ncbi:alternate-type signal peptide domain-containing protein [Microlunatus elymi]|uniref:Alternate-type signal peptide domain-containing protein n=1 Tax=Microlunatus elymi TaxID=2596828 RepID=A0A516PTK6_9ACTN|nr:alternate-type signal peptide domain-containing protein [Microlunatus elymi]QDP94518.1 alternate-type signal peptide domain-containing protein [Microlunatus elymi]
MKKTAKGAIAASAAVVLLAGGAGSLAYWTDSASVDGGTINSGHLRLVTDDTNTGCTDWTLDGGDPYVAGTTEVVPGDVLTKTCAFTLEAAGDHLEGTVEASAANVTGDLAAALDVNVSGLTLNGEAASTFTEANDGQALGVDVSVTVRPESDNTTMDVSAVLDSITVTATQTHA